MVPRSFIIQLKGIDRFSRDLRIYEHDAWTGHGQQHQANLHSEFYGSPCVVHCIMIGVFLYMLEHYGKVGRDEDETGPWEH